MIRAARTQVIVACFRGRKMCQSGERFDAIVNYSQSQSMNRECRRGRGEEIGSLKQDEDKRDDSAWYIKSIERELNRALLVNEMAHVRRGHRRRCRQRHPGRAGSSGGRDDKGGAGGAALPPAAPFFQSIRRQLATFLRVRRCVWLYVSLFLSVSLSPCVCVCVCVCLSVCVRMCVTPPLSLSLSLFLPDMRHT